MYQFHAPDIAGADLQGTVADCGSVEKLPFPLIDLYQARDSPGSGRI